MYKTKKSSGFHLYLLGFLDKPSNESTFEEIRIRANGQWNTLSKERRKDYRVEAEKIGFSEIDGKVEKIMKDYQDKKNLEKTQEIRAKETIKEFLKTSFDVVDDWNARIFVLGHVNYHVKVKNNFYVNEIGLVKYSLDRGVLNTFHTFIDSGGLPLGYEREACVKSNDTHQLPIYAKFGNDYNDVKHEIVSYLSSDEADKFIFTLSEDQDVEAMKNFLKRTIGDGFYVVPFEKLLCHYLTSLRKTEYEVERARKMLINDNPFEAYDIGCEYHLKRDISMHCSLSKAKRWAYHLSKIVLPHQLCYPGAHLPD